MPVEAMQPVLSIFGRGARQPSLPPPSPGALNEGRQVRGRRLRTCGFIRLLCCPWVVAAASACDNPESAATDTFPGIGPSTGAVDDPTSGGVVPATSTSSETGDPSTSAAEAGSSSSGAGSTGEAELLAETFPPGISAACLHDPLPVLRGLDQNQPGSVENAYWMMWLARRASKATGPDVLEELSELGFDSPTIVEIPELSVRALATGFDENTFLVFQGSVDPLDWAVNASFAAADASLLGLDGDAHAGFLGAAAVSWPTLEAELSNRAASNGTTWFTGHSLGGAMATLLAPRAELSGFLTGPTYVFGAPRVGDVELAVAIDDLLTHPIHRVVNERDLVAYVPPRASGAPFAADVLPAWPDEVEGLLLDLDYGHPGVRWQLAPSGALVVQATGDSDELHDEAYWSGLSSEGLGVFLSLAQVGNWHDADDYLCKLRSLMDDQ